VPLRELRARYGKTSGSAREAVNRAIRAELPGGAETLDAIELFYKIVQRLGGYEADGHTPTVAQVARDRLAAIAIAMEVEIRRRYGMPPLADAEPEA
jgi:hypothetical protein